MDSPKNLQYSKEHEWVRTEGDKAIIGITDHAQKELGEIVFIDLPKVGSSVEASETFGVVESVKTVSDLYSPVTGIIREVNEALDEDPEIVNNDPYGDGWLIIVEISDSKELDDLLNDKEYEAYIEEEKEDN